MKNLLESLCGQLIKDIVLRGVVDTDDEPVVFLPKYDRVYLVLENFTIEMADDDSEGKVRIRASIVNEVCAVVNLDEGQLPCQCSIGSIAFANPLAENRIKRVVAYNPDGNAYRAIEIVLTSDQILFFDPMFFNGINLGGVEQKAVWLANEEQHVAVIFGDA